MKTQGSAGKRFTKVRLVMAGLVVLALAAASTAGCAAGGATDTATTPDSNSGVSTAMNTASAKGMTCGACGGNEDPGVVQGDTVSQDGAQLIRVTLKDGRYLPNTWTAKAGTPVRVSFEGTATGCLGHPTFKSLNKKADITKASATVDLGALAPGTYKWSCAMGTNVCTITVQ